MGYAIIKDTNSIKGYALNRLAQNVVPVDETQWIYIPTTNNITFSYNEDTTDGVYRLSSLSGMSNYRQPYVYELVNPPANVTIDPISGVITVLEGFTGSSVFVRLKAIYNIHGNCYPPTDLFLNAVSNATVEVHVSAPSHAPTLDVYSDFSLSTFSYANSNTITAATLSTGTPTISYSYKLNGETQTDSCTYTFTDEYDGASVNSSGVVTFTSKNTTDSDKQCPVNITFLYPNGTLAGTGRAIVKQSARVLSSITFLSYNSASSISVNSGSSILASAFVIKATYNSGEVTVGPNSSDITISSTSSGTYGSAINNVTSSGTVYIKYKDYTSNIINKAYTVETSTNNLTVASNLGGYALLNTALTTDDFTVTDSNNSAVTNFTITPSTPTTKGEQTITISDGNGNTGSIAIEVIELSDFGIEKALLGVSSDGVDNTTLFKGPSNSSSVPYQEGTARHLGIEFLQTAKGGDQYLIYFENNNTNKPDNDNRIMASTLSVLDFSNVGDPYTGEGSSSANNIPAGYVSQQTSVHVNKLTLYTIPAADNDPDLILTAFAHFGGTSSLTKFYALRVGGRERAYITGISETAYSLDNLSVNTAEHKLTIPLRVNVHIPGNNTDSTMSFNSFISNNNYLKEQYDAPEIIYSSSTSRANMPQQSPTSDGSLLYDLNLPDYMYDNTSVTSINLSCNSNKNLNYTLAINQEFEVNKSYFDGYFNSTNFDIYELDDSTGNFNSTYFSGAGSSHTFGSGTTAVTVTALGEQGSSSSSGRHLSNSSFESGHEIWVSEDGYYYKLTSGLTNKEFYIGFTGKSYGAIISKNGDLTLGTNNTSTNYAMSDANTKSKFMPVSTDTAFMIARHTTTFDNTYLIKYGSGWIGRWYLFIKH